MKLLLILFSFGASAYETQYEPQFKVSKKQGSFEVRVSDDIKKIIKKSLDTKIILSYNTNIDTEPAPTDERKSRR